MNVVLWNRCLAADEVAQVFASASLEAKPEPYPAPDPPEVEKVCLTTTLTWMEHRDKAAEMYDGKGSLPTRADLILSSEFGCGKFSAGATDAWVPVCRDDGQEGDWVQMSDGHPHAIYLSSHLDAFGIPGWGNDNNAQHWRPPYFFVKH